MKRKTFLRKDTNQNDSIKHLSFIISDPDPDHNVMVVNLTTYYSTGREDESCILDIGDHSFIKHKSYIAYRYAKELNYVKLLDERFKGHIIFKEDISEEVLIKIQKGAKKSKLLPLMFEKYFKYF